MPAQDRWVLAYEYDSTHCQVPTGVRLRVGRTLLVGREGDLALGVAIPHQGISRKALEVTATEYGWDIHVSNTNGAVLHAWGQAPQIISGRQSVTWPRIAIRVLNGEKFDRDGAATHHWVLLEADMLTVTEAGPRATRSTTSRTVSPEPPLPLSPSQEQAVRLVFGELLTWPPRMPAEPLQLGTAARRIGISEAGVRDRLNHARDRTLRIGLHLGVGLTNPEYLYALVSAGFLSPPNAAIHRIPLPWLE